MINHPLIIDFFSVINMIGLVHLGLYLVGANTYDIAKLRRTKRAKTNQEKPYKPLISVVIPAHNEALVIKRTLKSVRASTYQNYEIIVIDDGSTDNTDQIVRDYVKHLPLEETKHYIAYESGLTTDTPQQMSRGSEEMRYSRSMALKRRFLRVPTSRIRTVRLQQTNAGKAAAMNNAIANHVKGELMMCLDADAILHPESLERAVAYFRDPTIMGIAANVRIIAGKSWLSKLQRFEHMIGYRSKKFYTVTNSEFIVGGVASTYRTEVVKSVDMYDTDTITEDIGLSMKLVAVLGNRGQRIVYASDVIAMTEGVHNFATLLRQRYRWKMGCLQNLFKYRQLILHSDKSKYSRMLTRYRLPMAIFSETLLLIEPLMFCYLIYLSFVYRTFGILLGAYLTVTIYSLWTIWPDEHFTRRQKLQLSLSALGIYVTFYAMDLVQLSAIYKCIKNYRTIISRQTDTRWVSPARINQSASFSN